MFIHRDSHFSIYFGGAQDELMPPYYLNLPDHPLLEIEPFSKLKEKMKLKSLFFLHQTHSDQGLVVTQNNVATIRPFKIDGDYLITRLKHTGIGVMTADCLPVVLYDNQAQVVSVIHAGWRGSVLGVVIKALERMQEQYSTQAKNVSAFFGPSALICCYEVSRDFESNLKGFSLNDKRKTVIERDGKLFFDVSLFNRLQLEAAGVQRINTEYNVCTMCNSSLYSHRRDASRAGRQMTVVSLI